MLRQSRSFSTARIAQSYIGSAPIPLPKEVSLSPLSPSSSLARKLVVSGPKGELDLSIPHYLKLSTIQGASGSNVTLSVQDRTVKQQRSMWGTTRALLHNSIVGVTEGFTVSLKFVGVGYRAAIDGTTIVLRVGFSKPVVLEIPAGIAANCPQPTALILNGRDKQVLTQFATVIRSYRKPEPYKGKGIFVNNETIKIKSPAGKK
ncbi:putative 60S ribosomal protein L6 [Taphrina deformans PYCC 5710]|uniref:60S ribosomal protein L6 n=1 Tax=Taphrina deformans (strain PYCC 5710 / ATCC 11124 / CBS 356.35 / IMI 108563 / JCM 9778 / NBRC 8474) TaxID=1097556 RepID=R4X9D9_TAPDE|nr:putative 60S ribosomal protein L6 [Taphrina deformans PYCC 5710]|eukprot:CCG80824.1 putative 60S ribosomal protein L6 [Taphrina deformans PYCC 5710]